MKKYFQIFKISFSRILEYRLDFVLGRLRHIVVLLLLFYVWRALSLETGSFASYTSSEIFTYVFLVNLLVSVVTGSMSREMAEEINSGTFSKYLAMPVNYFYYNFFRELAQRLLNLISATAELIIFALVLKVDLVFQFSPEILFLSFLSAVLALIIFYILSFIVSMMAFWSREAMGPRFLFDWFFLFASGAYFPLDILSRSWFGFALKLPFFYIVFFPLSIYLSKIDNTQIMYGFIWQLFWLFFCGSIAYLVWDAGMKKYSGEGI